MFEGGDLTPASKADFLRALSTNKSGFFRRGRLPPITWTAVDAGIMRLLCRGGERLNRTPGYFRLGMNRWPVLRELPALPKPNAPCAPLVVGLRRYYFPWAVGRALDAYGARSGTPTHGVLASVD